MSVWRKSSADSHMCSGRYETHFQNHCFKENLKIHMINLYVDSIRLRPKILHWIQSISREKCPYVFLNPIWYIYAWRGCQRAYPDSLGCPNPSHVLKKPCAVSNFRSLISTLSECTILCYPMARCGSSSRTFANHIIARSPSTALGVKVLGSIQCTAASFSISSLTGVTEKYTMPLCSYSEYNEMR